MVNNVNCLNTIAASAGDITLTAGKLNITNFSEKVKYLDITNINGGIREFLLEILGIYTVTYTAASSTTYSFTVSQVIDGNNKVAVISYTSDSTGTDAEIAAGIVSQFNKFGFQVTASGSVSPVTLTALTGYPVFSVAALSNVTIAAAPGNINTALQAGSVDTTTTPAQVNATAHGLSTGMTVTIAGVTGTGASVVNGTWRITRTSANQFTLDGSVGVAATTGTVTSATGVKVPQYRRGNGADLVADGVTNAVSTNLYATIMLEYSNPVADLNTISRKQGGNSQTLYVVGAAAATPNTAASNYADFVTRFNEVLNDYGAGVTTANPESISYI